MAVNLYKIRQAQDAGGELFHAVQRQKDQYQGIWIVAPDTRVLAGHHAIKNQATWTQEVLDTIAEGLKAFGPVKPRQAQTLNPLPYRGSGVQPDGSVSLAVYVRYMGGGGRSFAPASTKNTSLWMWDGTLHPDGPPVIDSLSITAAEWAAFSPPKTAVGTEWAVPNAVARKFVRTLSPASDQSTMPRPEEATIAELKATVESIEAGQARIRLAGRWEMKHLYEGKPSYGWAKAEGIARYDLKRKALHSLLLAFSGSYRAVPPYDTEDRPTGAVVEWQSKPPVASNNILPQEPGRASDANGERRKTADRPTAQEVGMWKDVSSTAKNPSYHPNTLFVTQEDLRSLRLSELPGRYHLEEVIQGQTDEFKRILLLRNWVHRRVVPDPGKPAVDDEDAVRILEEGPKGGQYHCGHLSKALNAITNAMGYVTRCVFAGAGEKEEPLSGAHGANEIWSNTYCKWILMDAEHDSHFEKDGIPLSALEIRAEVLRDGAAGVVRVQGPERKSIPRERDDSYGRTPRTYAWVSHYLEGNRNTIWPKMIAAYEVVYEDDYFRTHTWYRGGEKHWAYDAGYFKRIQDKRLVEWTPNVLDVKTQIHGNTAEVHIMSFTPNLKEYQMKRSGGDWAPVDATFTFRLEGDREERRLRSVNLAGVSGPEYRLMLERRRD